MKNFANKLYNFSLRSVRIMTLILTLFLFVCGFLFTCYAEDMTTQQVLTRIDNPFMHLIGGTLFGAMLLTASVYIARKSAHHKQILLYVTLGWILLSGCILIVFSKTVPAADAMSVYAAAEALAGGDTSVIHPTDSYLSYYPQQVGLMLLLELLFHLWNIFNISMPAYHFIKGIYVILLCIAVLFQYKTIHLIWENGTTDCIYLLLAGTNFPMIMYSSFVYGEIPSFTAFSIGMYYLYALFRSTADNRSTLRYGLLSLLFLTLSVMLRKNAMILIVAVVIVLLLEWLHSKRHSLLLLAMLCTLSAMTILPLVQNTYELRAGNSLKTGVPPMSYFAMGMQEADRGNGWYNGFNINTYQNNDMDTELTNRASEQAIRERLTYFRQNPGYAVQFYWYKHLSQWTDGTYASRQATLATFGGRHELFNRLYDGDFSGYYIGFYNIYQNVLYLGVLFFCLIQSFGQYLTAFRHKKETATLSQHLPVYIGLIGVIGGFLFHIIWEANSRYIFIYGLLLMPYTAQGLSLLQTLLAHHASSRSSRNVI